MASLSFICSLSFFTTLLFMLGISNVSAQLSPNFYTLKCPLALTTIKTAVTTAVLGDRRMGASLLRLHFHDCFVLGCDASVLLDDNATFTGEKTAFPNVNSLRGFELIDNIKSLLEILCFKTVSCADILAVAARDAVVALGGPTWVVQLGRRDSTTASLSGANSELPSPFVDLSTIISSFSNKNFTTNETVALSGAHTVGKARCFTFRNRIYNESNIDLNFANTRKKNCPSVGGDNDLAPLDSTDINFDNKYFTDLTQQKGLLHSDQQLYNGGSTDALVTTYSQDSLKFFKDFVNAMIKMGNLNILTGSNGEIRTNCSRVN